MDPDPISRRPLVVLALGTLGAAATAIVVPGGPHRRRGPPAVQTTPRLPDPRHPPLRTEAPPGQPAISRTSRPDEPSPRSPVSRDGSSTSKADRSPARRSPSSIVQSPPDGKLDAWIDEVKRLGKQPFGTAGIDRRRPGPVKTAPILAATTGRDGRFRIDGLPRDGIATASITGPGDRDIRGVYPDPRDARDPRQGPDARATAR